MIAKPVSSWNEIDLINYVHFLRGLSKDLSIAGAVTYRNNYLGLYAEGLDKAITEFLSRLTQDRRAGQFVRQNQQVIGFKRYSRDGFKYDGPENLILNEPEIDWNIEDQSPGFPIELLQEMLDLAAAH